VSAGRPRKVLVANRGEIAVRICRTLRAMGIPSVTVYSEADRGSLHARFGDESVGIGPAPPAESYLRFENVLEAASRLGCDAIHPGYGFLSENAAFASACRDAGITFIGPSPQSMARLGDKEAARRLAASLGVPVVPGEEGVETMDVAVAAARRIGYPLLLKAAAGGGGRGMRLVADAGALEAALDGARREALGAFGDGRLLVERYVHPARHVEVQILGNGADAVALGERECSLQRRHQKLIEESPSVAVDPDLRRRMEEAAIRLARAAEYSGAGTVEFLLGPDGAYFFLEVNTRLQVEHPVTELRTGLDLVRAQIEIASGGPLPVLPPRALPDPPGPADPEPAGHAIEARLNAEDAFHGFLPQTGKVLLLRWPKGEGVRVDAGVQEGQVVHSHYDSLLAKIVASGRDREEARGRLAGALRELSLLGLVTNQEFLIQLLDHPAFVHGETFTHTVESMAWEAPHAEEVPDEVVLAAAVALWAPGGTRGVAGRDDLDRFSPWRRLGAWGRA
jgi:acetyl/propionyl-CoA carboxylase alpha subunit